MQAAIDTAIDTATATVCQKFAVAGMSCHHCEIAIAAEVAHIEGVTKIVVDAAAGTLITESCGPLDRADIAAAVDEAGYTLI